MLIVGAAFIIFYLLVDLFSASVEMAAVITGIAFVLAALAMGERVSTDRRV